MHGTNSNACGMRSRRRFLADAAGAAAAVGVSGLWVDEKARGQEGPRDHARDVSVFSKCLQWLDYQGMAEAAAAAGFDGVDLTVRPGGHVLPERVADDLPKAVEAAAGAGIHIRMIVTAITDPADAQTETILKTAGRLGVRYYRLGHFRYNDADPIMAQLDEIRPRLRDLVAMNRQYGLAATYQNHAGAAYVGASLWDVHYLFDGLDPQGIGSQFDIRHAVVEGGTAWPISLRLLANRINTLTLKDFYWARQDNRWRPRNCPLGEGMVDLAGYGRMLNRHGVSGPVSLHLEYPLGGAEHGNRQIGVPRATVLQAMRSDLRVLRKALES